MITGAVTAEREAVIRLTVRGPADNQFETDVVIDTGFDGSISLPPELIRLLGLPWRRRGRAILADGSESLFDIYEGVVVWDLQPRRVSVDEAETAPLVGMALLDGYELNMQVRVDGLVTIKAMR